MKRKTFLENRIVLSQGRGGKIFEKGTDQKRLIDSPAAFSGGQLHNLYIELWADRQPTLESVEFDFGEVPKEPVKIQKYKDRRFGRDYNQLDQYIFDAVSFWNGFFLKQEFGGWGGRKTISYRFKRKTADLNKIM